MVRFAGEHQPPHQATRPLLRWTVAIAQHLTQQDLGLMQTQLYGPAVRCKLNVNKWRGWSCASVSGPWMERTCSWPSWISARTRSYSGKGPERPLGSPDHGCDGETVSPYPQSNSQTSAGILVDALGRRGRSNEGCFCLYRCQWCERL